MKDKGEKKSNAVELFGRGSVINSASLSSHDNIFKTIFLFLDSGPVSQSTPVLPAIQHNWDFARDQCWFSESSGIIYADYTTLVIH